MPTAPSRLVACTLVFGAATIAAASPRFLPWTSPDGHVRLLRPSIADLVDTERPVGALMARGWRLRWDGSEADPGTLLLRERLAERAVPPQTRAATYLQVGVSRAPEAVRTCLTESLRGGNGRQLADRTINGRRFAVWRNADAGMSQTIEAIDMRTVVAGACYAVERYTYADSASDPDPRIRLTPVQAAALLDESLASLRIGGS